MECPDRGRGETPKDEDSPPGSIHLNSTDLKTRQHRIYAGACSILHSRREIVGAWEWLDSRSTRSLSFVSSISRTSVPPCAPANATTSRNRRSRAYAVKS